MDIEDSKTELVPIVRQRKGLPPGFWPGVISGAFGLLIIGGLLAFLLSPEILKHRSPFPLEEAIGASRVSAAIPGDAKNQVSPLQATAENMTRGKQVFNSNCAICHGVSGKGDAPLGRNLFPPAANLTETKTADKTDGELHWIVQNGLSFVGMPSFKAILSNDDTWKAVMYIRAIQNGSAGKIAVAATAGPAGASAAATPASGTVIRTTPAATAAGQSSNEVAQGLALFESHGCANCHGGPGATGGLGPSLVGITFPYEGLLRQVRSGSGPMPAFSPAELPDSDVRLIYAFLRSLK